MTVDPNNFTIEIDLVAVRKAAEDVRDRLTQIRRQLDLTTYEYTRRVRIAPTEIPHSHPEVARTPYAAKSAINLESPQRCRAPWRSPRRDGIFRWSFRTSTRRVRSKGRRPLEAGATEEGYLGGSPALARPRG
jgi:hypothetical protein